METGRAVMSISHDVKAIGHEQLAGLEAEACIVVNDQDRLHAPSLAGRRTGAYGASPYVRFD
jgi:hypothetical protein